jgi:hypothetical protein
MASTGYTDALACLPGLSDDRNQIFQAAGTKDASGRTRVSPRPIAPGGPSSLHQAHAPGVKVTYNAVRKSSHVLRLRHQRAYLPKPTDARFALACQTAAPSATPMSTSRTCHVES